MEPLSQIVAACRMNLTSPEVELVAKVWVGLKWCLPNLMVDHYPPYKIIYWSDTPFLKKPISEHGQVCRSPKWFVTSRHDLLTCFSGKFHVCKKICISLVMWFWQVRFLPENISMFWDFWHIFGELVWHIFQILPAAEVRDASDGKHLEISGDPHLAILGLNPGGKGLVWLGRLGKAPEVGSGKDLDLS